MATSTRQVILDRIRSATHDGSSIAYDSLPRPYIRRGTLSPEAKAELMAKRLREYDAEVVECVPVDVAAAVASQLAVSGKRVFTAPQGLPSAWLAQGFIWLVDNHLDYSEIEGVEGVVTAASAGIADSGTIVLHHGAEEGRRVLSLLPDWHLCILFASQIVETLPEYFDLFAHPPALATYISGPSATADIEMTRIKGVHGPRFLNVVLVHDAMQSATGASQNSGAAQAGIP